MKAEIFQLRHWFMTLKINKRKIKVKILRVAALKSCLRGVTTQLPASVVHDSPENLSPETFLNWNEWPLVIIKTP